MDLPNELLCQVIEYLQFKRSLLGEVARANHRLHKLTQPYLFRYANDLSGYQQFVLSRTLKETPVLKKAIWSYGPIDTEVDGCVSPFDFNDVLGLTNLKTLQFRVIQSLPGSSKSHQSLFRSDVLGRIEEMELTAYHTPRIELSGVLHKFLSELPSVHTLTVMDMPTEFTASDLQNSTDLFVHTLPSLRTLKLRGIQNTSLDRRHAGRPMRGLTCLQLRDILEPFTHLKTLHCTDMFFHISGIGHLSRREIRHTTVRYTNLWVALREVRAHLQELVLTMASDAVMILDGPPLDLSAFTALNILHISSSFIIDLDGNKNTLHQRLPPNLEVLRIDFRIDYNPPHNDFGNPSQPLYNNHEQLLEYRWEWLLLFPTHKTSHFPKLKEVKIVENKPMPKPNYNVIRWELPIDWMKLSEKADIKMDIWIFRYEVT